MKLRYLLFAAVLVVGCNHTNTPTPPLPPVITANMDAAQIESAAEAAYALNNPQSKVSWQQLSEATKQLWRDWVVSTAQSSKPK